MDRISNPFEFRKAAEAMRRLLDDPEDTAQVFTIIQALTGNAHYRLLRRVKRLAHGRQLFTERPNLLQLLSDRKALAAMPEGSLGRAYLDFIEREGITADGLVQASEDGYEDKNKPISDELTFLSDRMRDTHDLWHAVTGYQGDLIGEACLLAFSFAQTRNPGVGFIVFIAFTVEGGRHGARSLIFEGFRRGLRAQFLPAQRWEEMLELPIAEVRRRLQVGEPPEYTPVRSRDVDVLPSAA